MATSERDTVSNELRTVISWFFLIYITTLMFGEVVLALDGRITRSPNMSAVVSLTFATLAFVLFNIFRKLRITNLTLHLIRTMFCGGFALAIVFFLGESLISAFASMLVMYWYLNTVIPSQALLNSWLFSGGLVASALTGYALGRPFRQWLRPSHVAIGFVVVYVVFIAMFDLYLSVFD
jgi:hypothetical protein